MSVALAAIFLAVVYGGVALWAYSREVRHVYHRFLKVAERLGGFLFDRWDKLTLRVHQYTYRGRHRLKKIDEVLDEAAPGADNTWVKTLRDMQVW